MAFHFSGNHPRAPGGCFMTVFASLQDSAFIEQAVKELGLEWMGLVCTPGLPINPENRDEVRKELQRYREWLPTARLRKVVMRIAGDRWVADPSDRALLIERADSVLQLLDKYVDDECEEAFLG